MYVSRFQINFVNKRSKTGYKWDGERLIPKQDAGFENVRYTEETYNHFTRLRQYYKDTDLLKIEGKNFHKIWGKFFENSKSDELDLMVAIHQYESFRFDLSTNKEPNILGILDKSILGGHTPLLKEDGSPIYEFQKIFGHIRLNYEWDREGNNLLPTYHPTSLWEAIKLNLILCGSDPQDNLLECFSTNRTSLDIPKTLPFGEYASMIFP